ncbi:MAG: FAD-dependent oxidoreductase [candidate division WOR-3 bacterium]|jgi:heterodisulfide reductase subunit A-like polyferredoxin|nr:FAD-dependent oxidoreductase [candidate division WOR-3 bacterium]MCR4424514.1 FAD-dependent oxidoreductase [candidate division WOR-3 bacterium]MDH7519638.1 FAD-dependent oxidoreductase [bacterium]
MEIGQKGRNTEEQKGIERVGAALVVGAGIAGIQSALELADSGFKVYLIDRAPAIGGVMAMLDKTFPTNDCSMCILAPKLVGTGRHPNIEILTGCEITDLEGEPGSFTVRLKQQPRFVNLEKCTGCMECVKVCPVRVPDQYNQGLSARGAVYKLFAQAIPNAVAIEKNTNRAPCRLACPAGVNAQGYVALTRARKFREAYLLVRERLPFVGICGRVCHHPCEEACNRKEVDEAVAIRAIKRFLYDWVEKSELVPYQRTGERESKGTEGQKVAVVGAGPAGLTCALDLVLKGYQVTVFEKSDKPGGMMRWGIPAYRLPREVLDKEIQLILDAGVELKLNSPVNSTAELEQLLNDGYQAVFVALGCHKSRTLTIPGMDLKPVLPAIEFLRAVNRMAEETEKSGSSAVPVGRRVVVIGGGNVAVDCAMCAKRLGAEEVVMVCLEKREEMPAHPWEIEEALADGIKLMPGWGPKAIRGENGVVSGLEIVECVRVFDDEHRFNPEFNQDNTGFVPADTVIVAIGQAVAAEGFDKIERGPGGIWKVDPVSLAVQGLRGVFAGGDMVSGPASVIEAVQAGHEAAISIDRYLKGESLTEGRAEPKLEPAKLEESAAARWGLIEKAPRKNEPKADGAKKQQGNGNNPWYEINLGFDEEAAVQEAERCLDCGVCCDCLQCVAACEAKALEHQDREREIELKVGAVVLAGGFKEHKPVKEWEYGYRRYPNVVTSLEFERILSATGPYEGQVLRPGDKSHPHKIAWIQCVGSRNEEHYYCSSVCCMFATKEAVIAKEHCGGNLDCHIYYMDMRCFGKGFERYYERAEKEYGVVYRRSRVARIEQAPNGQDLVISFEDENGVLQQEVYNMVVLSSGLVADPATVEMYQRLGVKTDEQGFVKTDPDYPVVTSRPGIYACGVCVEPKDIPETVTEATGCAGAVEALLAPARGSLVTRKEYPPERDVSLEEPRVGVFVCNCGINIGGVVRVPEVVEYARSLPGVVYAEENLFTCSQDTQERIRKAIVENKLNRVVVASCTPRTHEPLFQETLREAGLNPNLFTMANIRDQCSWVHMQIPEKATEKSKELVRMAVANARRLKPLRAGKQAIVQKALVIGGGLAGMTSALAIAEQGFEVYLVEKENYLGGTVRRLRFDEQGRETSELISRIERRLRENPKIEVLTGAEIEGVSGYLGNYRTRIKTESGERELVHGVFVVACGALEYKPQEYFYGRSEQVLTQLELEDAIETGKVGKEQGQVIAMIQCVGSRDKEHPWCSRVCCTEAIKNALQLKRMNPSNQVYIFYRDIRTYGFRERLYREAREAGVMFIRFDPNDENRALLVEPKDGKFHIAAFDPVLQARVGVMADLLVLSTGVVPAPDNQKLAQLLKVPLNEDGFFLEAHMKLRPVDFNTAGIFMAGMCHAPRFMSETIAQALAAAARACAVISQSEITTQAVVARVRERWCVGCGVCERICQYEAVRVNPVTKKSEVTPVLCQGCGACAAACPSNAIELQGFESRQLLSMVEEAL